MVTIVFKESNKNSTHKATAMQERIINVSHVTMLIYF